MPQWITVGSSWVDAVMYDAGDLYIRYKDKQGKITATCWYQNIPLQTWTDLLAAPSKGVFIHQSGIFSMPYTPI